MGARTGENLSLGLKVTMVPFAQYGAQHELDGSWNGVASPVSYCLFGRIDN